MAEDLAAAPAAIPARVARQGIGRTDPYGAARARVAALGAAGRLPALRPYYSPQRAGAYLGGILERNGLDEKGRPLAPAPGGGGTGPLRAVVRRAARGGAKSLYRVGRERVAPALRRWGQS
ncbi:hypothetical protein [Streptomyces sp. NPDC005251]|uniref:hypothetical protein n=1 Tax=unclassified Streptomyces TaxID=2593676 RepID=UPI0033B3C6E1